MLRTSRTPRPRGAAPVARRPSTPPSEPAAPATWSGGRTSGRASVLPQARDAASPTTNISGESAVQRLMRVGTPQVQPSRYGATGGPAILCDAFPARRAGRSYYLRGDAGREHITAGAAAALAGPPAGSYAAVLAARILDGQSALHLSDRCRGCGAGTRSSTCPDTRSSGRAYRATRSPFLPQSGSMEPRSRVTAGAGAVISSASRPRPARHPRHGAPDAAAR